MARRFGNEALAYLAEPLLAGIHAGDVDRLSLKALFPRFADAERKHGSLLKAFRTLNRPPAPKPGAPPARRPPASEGAFKSFPEGLEILVDRLVERLPRESLRTGSPVTAVSALPSSFRLETAGGPVDARALVLAAPAYAAAAIVRGIDAELAALCEEIPYASSATISFAFARDAVGHPLNGSGYVVPRVEDSSILAASWMSSKWPGRAPGGHVLLRVFVGGARDPRALSHSDAELTERALRAIRPVLRITGEPLLSRVYRYERSNAQHEVGHLDRVAAIDRALARHPGLFVTGSGFRGTGIPDCVADAKVTAGQAAEFLQNARTP